MNKDFKKKLKDLCKEYDCELIFHCTHCNVSRDFIENGKTIVDSLTIVYKNSAPKKPKKYYRRKKGEHLFMDCGGHPKCATCGCDEDDAFVGGEECTYGYSQDELFALEP